MKFLIFITPRDFRDESLATVKMFLDRWKVAYAISSYSNTDCIGSHGAVCKLNLNTGKADVGDYDGVILIDGRGMDNPAVYDYRPLLDLMLKFNDKKKTIIAIENAVRIPARANVIKGKRIATPKDQEVKRVVILFHGVPSEEDMEISDNVISIRDHGQLAEPMQAVLKHLGVA